MLGIYIVLMYLDLGGQLLSVCNFCQAPPKHNIIYRLHASKTRRVQSNNGLHKNKFGEEKGQMMAYIIIDFMHFIIYLVVSLINKL